MAQKGLSNNPQLRARIHHNHNPVVLTTLTHSSPWESFLFSASQLIPLESGRWARCALNESLLGSAGYR